MASYENKSNSTEAKSSTGLTTVVDTSGSDNRVATLYQCLMNCDEEKKFSEAGKRLKCGMDLKVVDHSGHKH